MNILQDRVTFSITRDEYQHYYNNWKQPIEAFNHHWYVLKLNSKLLAGMYKVDYTVTLQKRSI